MLTEQGEPRKLNDHDMTISCTDLWLGGWVSVPSQVGTIAPLLPLTAPCNSCKGGIGIRCWCALESAAKVVRGCGAFAKKGDTQP